MFLLLRCCYIASFNDTFRPFHGPSSGWLLYSLSQYIYIYRGIIQTAGLMFLLLRCCYIASFNDTFRPFHEPSSGWLLYSLSQYIYIYIYRGIIQSNSWFNVFITKMLLHRFFQRHVSALPRVIFRLITLFFARHTTQLAMLCYWCQRDHV